MPFVPDTGVDHRTGFGSTPGPDPSYSDLPGAALRQGNTIVSALQAVRNSGPFEPVEGYRAIEDIKDTTYFDNHADRFIGSRSPAETTAIKRQIDQEEADQRTLGAAGGIGVLASAAAGALDPTMLLPGRVAVGVAKDGSTLVRGAMEVGGAMAVQSTVQETALQASQQTRTVGESILNVGSATILGGLMGGAFGALSKGEQAALVKSMDTDRAAGDAHAMGIVPERPSLVVARKMPDGSIKYGEPGAVHSDLMTRTELNASGPTPPEIGDNMGFALPGGQFLTRDEALRFAQKYEPQRAAHSSEQSQFGLEASTYNEATPPRGLATSGGAAATDTRKLDLVPTGTKIEQVPTDPVLRTYQQPSVAARRGMADLAETAVLVKENLEGKTTTSGGAPLETIKRTQDLSSQAGIRDKLMEAWGDYRFNGKPPRAAILRDQLGMLDRGQAPTFEEFKALVSDAMMNGDKHDIPQVQGAAQQIRQHFEPWVDRAEKAIPEFEKLEPKEGEGYFPHAWNKPQIQAMRPEFTNKLTAHYAEDQAAKKSMQGRLDGLNQKLTAAQDRIAKAAGKPDKAEQFAAATADHDTIRKQIETELGKWEGKSAGEAKSALKAREKYEAERAAKAAEKGEKPPTKRLTSADDAIDKAVQRILASDRDKSLEDLRARANETTDRILSSPDGRLPYDDGAGKPIYGPQMGGDPMRGSLGKRMLDVSNAFARDWIERDVEKVLQNFNRTFMPDVLLAERFGDVAMENTFRQVNEEYAGLIDATGPGKERTALGKMRDRTIADLAATRDRFRGLYNVPTTQSQRNIARISGAVRNAMVPLNLGMAAVSSMSDAAGPVFQWGMASAFRDGWAPFVKSLMTNREYSREALREARVAGIAIDTFTANRHHELAGIADGYHPNSPLERTLQWGADKFQLVNGLAYWTDLVKTIAMTVNSQNLYRAVKAAAAGTGTKKQMMELGSANIPPALYEKIAAQYEKSGKEVDGVLLPNTADWTHETREAFEGALSRNVNINVVTPGLDKPLFMSDPTWAVLTQFKSFTAAAHNRILIANLQRADAQTLQGVVASLALGMVSYKFNAIVGGSPTSDRPQDWIKEAAARGSLFGWLEEGNALSSKLTRGGLDMYRLIGSDKPLSKYAGRTVMDQLLGPTFGKLSDLASITGSTASRDWTASDVKAMRRFIPAQNLFWLRGAFNQVEQGADNAFGIPPKAAKQ